MPRLQEFEVAVQDLLPGGDGGRCGAMENGAIWAVSEHSSTIPLKCLSYLPLRLSPCLFVYLTNKKLWRFRLCRRSPFARPCGMAVETAAINGGRSLRTRCRAELRDSKLGTLLMLLYGPAMFGYGQGFGAVVAVSETTRYSYFLPLALNFILSLSSENSIPVFTGMNS